MFDYIPNKLVIIELKNFKFDDEQFIVPFIFIIFYCFQMKSNEDKKKLNLIKKRIFLNCFILRPLRIETF